MEKIRGQHHPKKMADFGECIMFLPAKDTKTPANKADEKFKDGIWLGLNPRSGEVNVGTDNGVEMARTVRRKVESEAFDKNKILAIGTYPWDKTATQQTMPEFNGANPTVEKEYQKEPPGIEARRAYIYRKDIEKAGYTERCPGCKAMILNKVAQKHSEE